MLKITLSCQMNEFCKYLLIYKGLQNNTIENYRKIIYKILNDLNIILIDHFQIENYIVWLYNQNYSYNHILNICVALERYSDFIKNPIKLGRPRKPKRKIKNVLSEAEIVIILNSCKNIREKAILTLLAYSGIRNQELCDIKVKDIDFNNNFIHIYGKGCKERITPVSGECIQIILQYLSKFRRKDDQYLFTTLYKNKKYTGWALRRLVKTVVARTNISKRVYPHIFRHSLATNMLYRGANLFIIKDQLGHESIESTLIYISPKNNYHQTNYLLFTPSYI